MNKFHKSSSISFKFSKLMSFHLGSDNPLSIHGTLDSSGYIGTLIELERLSLIAEKFPDA